MSATAVTVTPHLCCRSSAEAIEFYQRAFGAEVVSELKLPSGQMLHAAITISGAPVFLYDEFPEMGEVSPLALGGSGVTLHLQVPNCDEVYQRALAAGCEVRMPMEDMFWGHRYGVVSDPFGHKWSIATVVREVSPEELQKVVAGFTG